MTLEQKIVEIADRLGFEAARLWPQVVAITWVKSLCYLMMQLAFVSLVWAALLVYWRKFFNPAMRRYREQCEESPYVDKPVGWVTGLIVGTVAALFITGCSIPRRPRS
jgi:hypothetical protein